MKEEKVGKKPKGMVVVISVGKPSGKKPEREADPDTKKKHLQVMEYGLYRITNVIQDILEEFTDFPVPLLMLMTI